MRNNTRVHVWYVSALQAALLLVILVCGSRLPTVDGAPSWFNTSTLVVPEGYDGSSPPVGPAGEFVNVSIIFMPVHVHTPNTDEGTFQMDFNYHTAWRDPRLQFSPDIPNRPFKALRRATSDVWSPEINFVNVGRTVGQYIKEDTLFVYPDGSVERHVHISGATFSNAFDIRDYPFDKQRLTVIAELWENDVDAVQIVETAAFLHQWAPSPVEGWDFKDAESRRITSTRNVFGRAMDVSMVELSIEIKRQHVPLSLTQIFPMVCLFFLTWLTYWIPTSSVTAKIAVVSSFFFTAVLQGTYILGSISSQANTWMHMFVILVDAFIASVLMSLILTELVDKSMSLLTSYFRTVKKNKALLNAASPKGGGVNNPGAGMPTLWEATAGSVALSKVGESRRGLDIETVNAMSLGQMISPLPSVLEASRDGGGHRPQQDSRDSAAFSMDSSQAPGSSPDKRFEYQPSPAGGPSSAVGSTGIGVASGAFTGNTPQPVGTGLANATPPTRLGSSVSQASASSYQGIAGTGLGMSSGGSVVSTGTVVHRTTHSSGGSSVEGGDAVPLGAAHQRLRGSSDSRGGSGSVTFSDQVETINVDEVAVDVLGSEPLASPFGAAPFESQVTPRGGDQDTNLDSRQSEAADLFAGSVSTDGDSVLHEVSDEELSDDEFSSMSASQDTLNLSGEEAHPNIPPPRQASDMTAERLGESGNEADEESGFASGDGEHMDGQNIHSRPSSNSSLATIVHFDDHVGQLSGGSFERPGSSTSTAPLPALSPPPLPTPTSADVGGVEETGIASRGHATHSSGRPPRPNPWNPSQQPQHQPLFVSGPVAGPQPAAYGSGLPQPPTPRPPMRLFSNPSMGMGGSSLGAPPRPPPRLFSNPVMANHREGEGERGVIGTVQLPPTTGDAPATGPVTTGTLAPMPLPAPHPAPHPAPLSNMKSFARRVSVFSFDSPRAARARANPLNTMGRSHRRNRQASNASLGFAARLGSGYKRRQQSERRLPPHLRVPLSPQGPSVGPRLFSRTSLMTGYTDDNEVVCTPNDSLTRGSIFRVADTVMEWYQNASTWSAQYDSVGGSLFFIMMEFFVMNRHAKRLHRTIKMIDFAVSLLLPIVFAGILVGHAFQPWMGVVAALLLLLLVFSLRYMFAVGVYYKAEKDFKQTFNFRNVMLGFPIISKPIEPKARDKTRVAAAALAATAAFRRGIKPANTAAAPSDDGANLKARSPQSTLQV